MKTKKQKQQRRLKREKVRVKSTTNNECSTAEVSHIPVVSCTINCFQGSPMSKKRKSCWPPTSIVIEELELSGVIECGKDGEVGEASGGSDDITIIKSTLPKLS